MSARINKGILWFLFIVAFFLFLGFQYSRGPWRGFYYANRSFEGKPILSRSRRLLFDWGEETPFTELLTSGFSAQWDTCLRVKKPETVSFSFGSYSSATFYMDGELVAFSSGSNLFNDQIVQRDLFPGMHRLQVNFIKNRRLGAVRLAARSDSSRDVLVSRNLVYPDACREERAP